MLKGYTLPKSPKGTANIVPTPPWHYVGNVLAIEYEANSEKIKPYLPEYLELDSEKCCIYFVDWQYSSDQGKEYLNPVESQYKETIVLMSAKYKGQKIAYCPYIWVDQDKALIRGLIQGWPKQLGQTHVSKLFTLNSKAAPRDVCTATLTVYGKRYVEGAIQLSETWDSIPEPTFAGSALLRYFPNLQKDHHAHPLVNELVQLKSRDVQIGPIRKGHAELAFTINDGHELKDFAPVRVLAGYQFEVALVVDDLKILETL